jgi:hypothetical protein
MTQVIVPEVLMTEARYVIDLDRYFEQYHSMSSNLLESFDEHAEVLAEDADYDGEDLELVAKACQASRLLIHGRALQQAEGQEPANNAVKARLVTILKQTAEDASRQAPGLLA